MKIAVLCHGTVLLPAINMLSAQSLLVGIGVPEIMPAANDALKHAANAMNLPFTYLSENDLEKDLSAWLSDLVPDVVCMMGFPYRIPEAALSYPRYGFYNFHGGKLPEYPGADPVFWQLRRLETEGAITVHRVESAIDTGAVAYVEPVPLSLSDTYGMVMQRLGQMLPRALVAFVQQLAVHGKHMPLVAQRETGDPATCSRPTTSDQAIRWEESARRIDALVRSCNPVYNGALTRFKDTPVRILNVELPQAASDTLQPPGTILNVVQQEGIAVSCNAHSALIVKIICTEGGVHTAGQFAGLFNVKSGDSFMPFAAGI